jgi:hypothetical protein
VETLLVRIVQHLGSGALVVLLASCTGGPATVTVPEIDPAAAAQAAIAEYDKNADQALSADEIKESALTLQRWDADANGSISQQEIEQRLTKYVDHGTAMAGVHAYVMQGGRPLEGAEITLLPEEFLGDTVHPAYGKTGSGGGTALSVAQEFRLRPELQAVEIGLYQVQITHPQVAIGKVTPHGYELCPFEDVVNPTFNVSK